MHNSLQPLEKIRRSVGNLQKNNFLGGLINMFDVSNLLGKMEPKIDISETKDKVLVTAELPGVSEDNIDVEISMDGSLTISGEKKHENTEASKDGYFSEISYGHVSRTIPLPGNLDYSLANADYKNGVLTISIPKLETEQKKRKKIAVKQKNETVAKQPKVKSKKNN